MDKLSPILLVEDNEQDELLALRALKQQKVPNEVHVVRDGEEAVEYLKNPAVLPKVVLLDLKLPKLNGLEVLKKIRENPLTEKLPVVILTTSSETSDIKAGYKLGANSFVRKPVSFTEFEKVVETMGQYWLRLNLSPVS